MKGVTTEEGPASQSQPLSFENLKHVVLKIQFQLGSLARLISLKVFQCILIRRFLLIDNSCVGRRLHCNSSPWFNSVQGIGNLFFLFHLFFVKQEWGTFSWRPVCREIYLKTLQRLPKHPYCVTELERSPWFTEQNPLPIDHSLESRCWSVWKWVSCDLFLKACEMLWAFSSLQSRNETRIMGFNFILLHWAENRTEPVIYFLGICII